MDYLKSARFILHPKVVIEYTLCQDLVKDKNNRFKLSKFMFIWLGISKKETKTHTLDSQIQVCDILILEQSF